MDRNDATQGERACSLKKEEETTPADNLLNGQGLFPWRDYSQELLHSSITTLSNKGLAPFTES